MMGEPERLSVGSVAPVPMRGNSRKSGRVDNPGLVGSARDRRHPHRRA